MMRATRMIIKPKHFIFKACLAIPIINFAGPAPIKAETAQLIFTQFAIKLILFFRVHSEWKESSKDSLLWFL